jgi:DNA-binding IclR family transcriptional regulator
VARVRDRRAAPRARIDHGPLGRPGGPHDADRDPCGGGGGHAAGAGERRASHGATAGHDARADAAAAATQAHGAAGAGNAGGHEADPARSGQAGGRPADASGARQAGTRAAGEGRDAEAEARARAEATCTPRYRCPIAAESPAYAIESVGRALRLLTIVAEQGSVSVSAAAEQLGVARSTAHRMLSTLLTEGFVRQDPVSKTYSPGRRMLEVGLAALRNLDVRSAARPELEALRDELGETVHLVLLEGTHILFLDSVESPRAVRVGSRTGMTMPAHCTAAGKAILAALPPAALEEYLAALPDGLTPNSIEDPGAIRAEIARTAERGWATNYEESEDGLSAVAVALPEPSGTVRSSITVSLPAERLKPDGAPGIAEAATRSAQAIGARLLRAVTVNA